MKGAWEANPTSVAWGLLRQGWGDIYGRGQECGLTFHAGSSNWGGGAAREEGVLGSSFHLLFLIRDYP